MTIRAPDGRHQIPTAPSRPQSLRGPCTFRTSDTRDAASSSRGSSDTQRASSRSGNHGSAVLPCALWNVYVLDLAFFYRAQQRLASLACCALAQGSRETALILSSPFFKIISIA